MSSSSSTDKKSGSGSGSGDEEGNDAEVFDMWRIDPVRYPSTDYLIKLEQKLSYHERNSPYMPCSPYLTIYRNWVEKIDRYREMAKTGLQPCSASHHFEGDELFSGFIEKTGGTNKSPIFRPWECPTREEMNEWISGLKHVEYRPKVMGLFKKTVNKFVQDYGFFGFDKPICCLDLLPSTKENPWPARIIDPNGDKYMTFRRVITAIVLVGHDTVLAPKKNAPIFLDLQDQRGHAFQLLCFDITFMGLVFPLYWKDRTTGSENQQYYYPRFYGCTFTETLALNRETILVDCQGKKVVIAPGNTCRFLNCKFDEVVVNVGRILAKGCEFGTLELVKGAQADALYFLEACTIGETKNTALEAPKFGWNGPPVAQFKWDSQDPVLLLRQAFENIVEYSFNPAEFDPDEEE